MMGNVRDLVVRYGSAGILVDTNLLLLLFIGHLDLKRIESFKRTNRAVIVEEGWRSYGVGAEVAARLYEEAFDYIDAPIRRVAQKEVPLPYNQALEQMALPQREDIIEAVKGIV
jgi:pyruvate dehydrogenase E1 component beta subunit